MCSASCSVYMIIYICCEEFFVNHAMYMNNDMISMPLSNIFIAQFTV